MNHPVAPVSFLIFRCGEETVAQTLLAELVDSEALLKIPFDTAVLGLHLVERGLKIFYFHAKHVLRDRRVTASGDETVCSL